MPLSRFHLPSESACFFCCLLESDNWPKVSCYWNSFWGNVLEGVLRLVLLVGYIWGIGFMPDIRRVFQYHGAEHKTINAFEANADLTPRRGIRILSGTSTLRNFILVDPGCYIHRCLCIAGTAACLGKVIQPHRIAATIGFGGL